MVPLSTMLRSLVLEKELRLKEELLMMGATRTSYYASILTVHGTSFLVTALICAAEIGASCYTRSDTSLYLMLFITFALATLSFTLVRHRHSSFFVAPCPATLPPSPSGHHRIRSSPHHVITASRHHRITWPHHVTCRQGCPSSIVTAT